VHALVATHLEDLGVLAAFTERTGGVSGPPFESLNASFSVGDDPGRVRANRRRVIEALDVPAFALAGLVHGAGIARVAADRSGAGFDSPEDVVRGADALATEEPARPLAVTTADCVPLVLASRSAPTVVVVHAGWRGLAAGILRVAVRCFSRPGDVLVAIGPAVGIDHYEVGPEVAAAVGTGCGVEPVVSRRRGKLALDLAGTAASTVSAAGVGGVVDAAICTACEPSRFFSHRRDGAPTGRQLAIAARLGSG
jgi:YfiH family protein